MHPDVTSTDVSPCSSTYMRNTNEPGADETDMTSHGMMGTPGVFFNYEISPMKVFHTETRQSFAHFLTSYVLFTPPPLPSHPRNFTHPDRDSNLLSRRQR